MQTAARIDFSFVDTTARADSTPACADAQAWCDVADLCRETIPQRPKYGTLEPRQYLMDGSFAFFPDAPKGKFWGLWSRQQSDADGRFATPPVLDIRFADPHTSAGVTLHFEGLTDDFCTDVQIEWYAGTELIRRARFAPDAADFICRIKVENYTRLWITFCKTNKPQRYLKLTGIDYGERCIFSGEDIIEANIIEEIDPLSDCISINTLGFTLCDRAGRFDMLNPDSAFDALQDRQTLTVYEDVHQNGRMHTVNMGTFYLSSWENPSRAVAKFQAVDAVGLLDAEPFDGGMYNTAAGQLAKEILQGYPYDLAAEFAAQTIRGWLPIGSKRDALQQLAFALGAVVDCSRKERIQIVPLPQRPSKLIGIDRKFEGESEGSLRTLVTGAAVTAHRYIPAADISDLYKDTLDTGTHRIEFAAPAAELAAEGGEILQSNCNYAIVRVSKAGEVRITGRKYADAKSVVSCYAAGLPPYARKNEVSVQNATLVDPARAGRIAQHILDLKADRVEQSCSIVLEDEIPADMVIVENGQERVRGIICSADIDLTGGFAARLKIIGTRLQTTADAYAGGEIYTGERSLM